MQMKRSVIAISKRLPAMVHVPFAQKLTKIQVIQGQQQQCPGCMIQQDDTLGTIRIHINR